jgi:hypothetical protein
LAYSQAFRTIDDCPTPLEKLDCVSEIVKSILGLLEISGEGTGMEGEDRIKPIFIYIVIMAAPKRIITSIK